MSDNTIEAIQAHLQGFGFILIPGSPDDPPEFVDDEWLSFMQPRKFKVANPNGPVFEYKYSIGLKRWFLQNATIRGTDSSIANQENEGPGD